MGENQGRFFLWEERAMEPHYLFDSKRVGEMFEVVQLRAVSVHVEGQAYRPVINHNPPTKVGDRLNRQI